MGPRRTLRSGTDKQPFSPSLSLDDLKKSRRKGKRGSATKRLDSVDLEGGEILEVQIQTPAVPYHVRYPDIFPPARVPRLPRIFTDCYKQKVQRFMELSRGNPKKYGMFESDKWFRNLIKSLTRGTSQAVIVKDVQNWMYYFPGAFAMGTDDSLTDESNPSASSESARLPDQSSTVSRDAQPDSENLIPANDFIPAAPVTEPEQSSSSADRPESPGADLPEPSGAALPEPSASDLHDVLHWAFGAVSRSITRHNGGQEQEDSVTNEGGTTNQSCNPISRATITFYGANSPMSGRSSSTSGIESIEEVNVVEGTSSSTLTGQNEHGNGTFAVPQTNAMAVLGNENPPSVVKTAVEVKSAVAPPTFIAPEGGEASGQTVTPKPVLPPLAISDIALDPLTPPEVSDEYLLSLIATPTLGEYHAQIVPAQPNPAVTLPQQSLGQAAKWGHLPQTTIPFPSTHSGLAEPRVGVAQGCIGTGPPFPTHFRSQFDQQQHPSQRPLPIQTLLHHSEGVLNALSQIRAETPYNPINSLSPAIDNVERVGQVLYYLAKMM